MYQMGFSEGKPFQAVRDAAPLRRKALGRAGEAPLPARSGARD